MKKIIICMLLLLPLIIVASVLIAVDIISVEAYIPVERVELNHYDLEFNLSDGSYSGLVATVYPTSAKDKKVTWSIREVRKTLPDFEGRAADVDKDGKVSFYTYATFKVTAQAAGKTAECRFYIKGDKPEQVSIDSAAASLSAGSSAMLTAVFHPVDAVVGRVSWHSDNEEVLSVDNNGIVTALSPGEAVVTVEIPDTAVRAQRIITVTPGITPYGDSFNTADGSRLGGIIAEAVSGGRIEDGRLYFDADSAVLTVGGAPVTVYKCAPDDIIIKNASFFDGSYKLRVGKLPLTLSVAYRDALRTDVPETVWSSSDTAIAEIDGGGLVKAKETGEVTFTAAAGGRTVSITVKVVKPISLIVLNMPDDKRGVAQRLIYGNTDYADGQYTRAYVDVLFTLPRQANPEEFIYSSSDASAAYFEHNRLYFGSGVAGINKVTIKVSAKERPYESVEVFEEYDIWVGAGVNCKNYAELAAVTAAGKRAFLQSDIDFDMNAETIVLTSDLYGNGYSIDAFEYAYINGDELDGNSEFVRIAASGVTVSNIRLTFDDYEKIAFANGMNGTIIAVGQTEQPERFSNIRVEYSIIENGFHGMAVHNSDVEVRGCIIRNTSNFGITMPVRKKSDKSCDYSNLTLKNNIMSNMVAPAVGISAEASGMDRQGSLRVQGFLDVYNWQDISASRMLDRELVKNEAANTWLKGFLSKGLAAEFARPTYDRLRYTVREGNTQTHYLHLGIIQAGALYESTTEVILEDPGYIAYEIEILKTVGITIPVTLYCYTNRAEITPESVYEESLEVYARLRS